MKPAHTPEPPDSVPATAVTVKTLPGGGEPGGSGVIAEAETVDAARTQATAAAAGMHSLAASHDLDALTAASLDALKPARVDVDDPNATHLTASQVDALTILCGRYSVAFNPAAYLQPADLPAGWVSGWVGPIYVGCDPEGRISS